MNPYEIIQSHFNTSQEISSRLLDYFKAETLEKGEMHTSIGQNHCKLSFVLSGYLRVYRQDLKHEVTQWVSSPSEIICDLNAILFDAPARWNIEALTPIELLSLSQSDYFKMQQTIKEWPAIEKAFMAKCFISIEERVYQLISQPAADRYQFLVENRPDLIQHIPQQYLASMIGMSAETFSRMRKKSVS